MRMVIKMGGALDGSGQQELIGALDAARKLACEVILVHGGGPEISRRLSLQHIELPFVDGLRQTTEEAISVVMDALKYCHEQIRSVLLDCHMPVTSFVDGSVVRAKDIGRGRTGEVSGIYPAELLKACDSGRVPLVPPYGRSEDGRFFNVNADVVASHVAAACQADKLIFCTNVAGVFTDFDKGVQLYDVTPRMLNETLSTGALSIGMLPKVKSMLLAHERGVPEVWVADGTDGASLQHAVTSEPVFDSRRRVFGTRLISRQVMTGVQRNERDSNSDKHAL